LMGHLHWNCCYSFHSKLIDSILSRYMQSVLVRGYMRI
jgi:hypothetical protein